MNKLYVFLMMGPCLKKDLGSIFFWEAKVIVELTSIENQAPVHFKQLHMHLRLADLRHGILVNFNVNLFKEGFFRRFNNLAA